MIKIIAIFLSLLPFIFSNVYAAQPPANVAVTKVFEKKLAKTNSIAGIIDFDKKAKISSEISGAVKNEFIVEGAPVKKGDVLVSLLTDIIEKQIDIKRKEVEQTDIEIAAASRDLERNKKLLETSAISEKSYQDTEENLNLLIKKKEIQMKNIELLELNIAKSKVTAPFDGIILEKYIEKGEWLSPGTPICTLASVSDLCVKVAVPEDLLKYITIGREISLSINTLGKKLTGKIKNIIPLADLGSKTFQIKIAVPYFKKAIQNMSVNADIPVSDDRSLKMIKRDALVMYNGGNFVYIVQDEKAKILPINIVAYEKDYIGIDNPNIIPGMSVITDGNERLRPDQDVKVVD